MFMKIAEIKYLGGLRNNCKHLNSGDIITTDAPLDNRGKGQAFSPTDLMSTSLAACMITIIGIIIRDNNYPVIEITADVYKTMESEPRRVSEIKVDLFIKHYGLDEVAKRKIEIAGRNCPVALSLNKDIKQEISFVYAN